MKKLFLIPLAVALLAIPVSAHQGDFLAVQWADDGLPTIDGNLTEWQALPDYFSILIEDTKNAWDEEPDKADLDFGFWGGYNPNNDKLYAAAWAFDNIHVRDDPDGTDCACNDDSYEFFTDGDHSVETGNDYGNGWWNITWPPVNGVSHAGGGGAQFTQQSGNMDYAVTFDGEEFGESTYYYEVEFATWDVISFDGDGNDDGGSVQSDLVPGNIMHWSMIMTDDDAELSHRAEQYDNGRWKNDGWWVVGLPCAHSDRAADFELDTDVQSAGGAATAVEATTWGRLKSRF
jgi:hypothetical protein